MWCELVYCYQLGCYVKRSERKCHKLPIKLHWLAITEKQRLIFNVWNRLVAASHSDLLSLCRFLLLADSSAPSQRFTAVIWRTRHNRCTRRCFCRRPWEHHLWGQWDPLLSLAGCFPLSPEEDKVIKTLSRCASYITKHVKKTKGWVRTRNSILNPDRY